MKKEILHILLLFVSITLYSQNKGIVLKANWEFHKKGSETWSPASVPGNVHSDLKMNEQIPDPFFADNEQKVQWVEHEDWEYKTVFICDKKMLLQSNIELKFEGLDTYAKVYLNDKLILESDNMFRSWLVNIKKQVIEGENKLLIIFESAVKRGKAEATKLPYTLPGDEKIFTRKAQYQYGWDWGPRLVTCGIWKPIKLITWNKLKIESIYAYTKEIKDSTATIDFILDIKCETDGYYAIRYNYTDKKLTQSRVQTKLVHLKPGTSTNTITINIPKAKLWWCNGMNKGGVSLYAAGFKITKDDSLITQEGVEFGIRTIELIQNKDSFGSSFYFKLNGFPVFMKGANYIPQNSFVPSVQRTEYGKLITMAKEANMNMLRVWGGGVYGDEEFYKDCDNAGILIWQDFMFACAMYPGDSKFIENVGMEVKEQVIRLRNHPCIALWCGNNEIDEGWKNWGWQKQYNYSFNDSAKIYDSYVFLFEHLIPDILKTNFFEAKNYCPSSPSIGWGHKESLQQGDSHYWGVWWGNEPFENYEKKVGRFMSEYGFQSLPSLSTFKLFCDSVDLNLNSASVKNHQKHPKGFETITAYMERDYIVPKDFQKFIYVSQLLQAEGMKTAIEAHRRAKPYCMGTLFWQFNDCWPAISWSAVDFFHTPKAFYYSLSNLYDDILLSVKKETSDYKIYLVNDKQISIEGKLIISVFDFSGKEIFTKSTDIKMSPNSSASYTSLMEKEIKGLVKEKMYLRCQFISADQTIYKKVLYYFTSPKNLKLTNIKPEISYNPSFGIIKIKSTKLIKNLYLSCNEAIFTKNYFDLEPNEEVEIKSKSIIKSVEEIKFMSLNDINQ